MKKLSFIKLIATLFIGLINQGCRQNSEQLTKSNVILIMTDDQGCGDLASHGNPYIETPNLNKLHSESIRLTNFHVNPFCAPTQAALMTGRFSDLTHVLTTINGRNHLNVSETIMAEYFKASGYKTGQFGKWHLGRNYQKYIKKRVAYMPEMLRDSDFSNMKMATAFYGSRGRI